jgi:hypothetical protein
VVVGEPNQLDKGVVSTYVSIGGVVVLIPTCAVYYTLVVSWVFHGIDTKPHQGSGTIELGCLAEKLVYGGHVFSSQTTLEMRSNIWQSLHFFISTHWILVSGKHV